MDKGHVKVMKTYGRHKNRVIKADVWDSEFNSSIRNIFNISASFDDDSDFIETKQLRNGSKRKKDEDKENKATKRGKSTRGKKKKNDHKLFSEKESTSSFSDFCEGGPLKDLPPKVVPASARKNCGGNRTKLHFQESQLQIESKEKSLSINFSDFDNYNLCISDSPTQTTAKTEHSASHNISYLGKGLSPEIFSRITECSELTSSDKNMKSPNQKDAIIRKPQKNVITTSTPLVPVTAVSRLQTTQSKIPDDHSLFEQTHAVYHEDSKSDISNLNVQNDSLKYSSPFKINSLQLSKDNLSPTEENDTDSTDHSIYDCFVQLMKLDEDTENCLDLSDHFGQFVSLRSKDRKIRSNRQLSAVNDASNNKNREATGNKAPESLESSGRISSCANCSFDHPCGDRCAYSDIKLSPDICAVQLERLKDFFGNLEKPESPTDLDLDVKFDASKNLFDSYFHVSDTSSGTADTNDNDDDIGKVAIALEGETDLDVDQLNRLMNSALLSDVEEEVEDEEDLEEELVSLRSRDEGTDEEIESGDVQLEYCSPASCDKHTKEEVAARLPLSVRSPYLTRNYVSSICTDADSVCTNITQSSLLGRSVVRSPYITRSSRLLVVNSDESKAEESLPSTPGHDGSGHQSYNEHMEGYDGSNSSHMSADVNVSSLSRRSFIELLSPQISPLSPKSKVLEQCDQNDFISFSDCIHYSMMKNCVKIGEGVYGEVFRTKKKGQSVALKIIPIEGDFEVNESPQKNFAEMLPEIVISTELSGLRNGIEDNTQNFVLVNNVSCLKGAYPSQLLRQWDIFHKQKRSENDRPDLFDKDQLFILFEFGDGGSALEVFKFNNLRQAKCVLQQVAYGLAIAESAFEFEHRDLHWGNVLVRPCANEKLHYRLEGTDIYLPSYGLEVSIIDFTLSRLRKDGCTVFCDLAKDELLFDGSGDYQFDVYRLMRAQTENEWERYRPKTNVYWIHYLADKLLKCKKYEEYSREDNEILRSLRQFVRDVTSYASTIDLVTTCPFMMASV